MAKIRLAVGNTAIQAEPAAGGRAKAKGPAAPPKATGQSPLWRGEQERTTPKTLGSDHEREKGKIVKKNELQRRVIRMN